MKRNLIKALLIVNFLIIMIPAGKLTIPNGGIIVVTILEIIEYLPEDGLKANINLESFMALTTLASFVLIVMQRKLFNLIGIALQFIWLGYLLRREIFNDVYSIVTISSYLLMSLALIFELLHKKEHLNSIQK